MGENPFFVARKEKIVFFAGLGYFGLLSTGHNFVDNHQSISIQFIYLRCRVLFSFSPNI